MLPSSTGTSAADALLDTLLARAPRSIVIVGTAKNTGKTVTFNALRRAAFRRGMRCAVTSLGRDGEPADALDGRRKPRVRLEPGTVVALPRALLPAAPALEILAAGAPSALGQMIFARARCVTETQIGGPPRAHDLRAVIDRLAALSGEVVMVDGALDRLAPLAGGDDRVVIATGAASGATVAEIAAVAGDVVARLLLPAVAESCAGAIRIAGALDARCAHDLIVRHRGATVVVADPTRVVVRGKLFAMLRAAVDLRCAQRLCILACTTSSAGGAASLDARALVRAVAAATGLPTFDLVAGLAA
ncbi:MAG: hypothetical protein ABR591_10180 [Candidatus Velthaea sp.]